MVVCHGNIYIDRHSFRIKYHYSRNKRVGLLKRWIAWIMCINSNIFYLPKFLVKAYCAIFFQSRLFTLTWDELLLKSFQWMLHQSLYKAGEYKNISSLWSWEVEICWIRNITCELWKWTGWWITCEKKISSGGPIQKYSEHSRKPQTICK